MKHPYRIVPAPKAPVEMPTPPKDSAEKAHAAEAAAQAAEAETRARLRDDAVERGYEEGLRRGRKEAIEAIEASIGPAVQMLKDRGARLEEELRQGRKAMARAAITIGKTLAETLVAAPRPFDREDLLHRILEEARPETAQGRQPLICRAAPTTLAEIRAAFPETLCLLEDETMKPGGFVIELEDAESGTVLERWDASVERMEETIRGLNFDV